MENLDDASTSGRVTRSLRKRLASVDSNDAGSRPSTPQLTKLTTIPELSSPRSLRGSRRNSITGNITPSKTPARTKNYITSELSDIENSLAKRPVRKSGVFETDSHTPNKSVLLDVATSKIDELSDEGFNAGVKGTPARRSTRLSSKSPTQLELEKTPRTGPAKRIKPGPKSRRSKQISDSDSEVEVINLEETSNNTYFNLKKEDEPSKSPSRKPHGLNGKNASTESKSKSVETIDLSEETVILNDQEDKKEDLKLQDEVEEKVESSKNRDSVKIESNISDISNETPVETLKSSLSETSALKESDNKNECTLRLELSDDDNEKGVETTKTPEKSASPKTTTNSQSQAYPCVESIVVLQKLSPRLIEKLGDESSVPSSPPSSQSQAYPLVESVVELQKLSPKVIEKLCGEGSVPKSPPNSKFVAFNDLDNEDDVIKSTYPKTPASIKSKSYPAMNSPKDSEDRSFQSDKGSSASFKDASAYIDEGNEPHEYEIQENHSKESIEFHDATNDPEEDRFEKGVEVFQECTPHKKQLYTQLLSSTPMLVSVSKSKPEPEENLKVSEENIKSTKFSPEKPPKKSSPAPINSGENNADPEKSLQSSANRNDAITSLIHQSKNGVATGDNNDGADEKANLFSKSWTHNVSGCATYAGKIDIITENSSGKKGDQEVTSENWKLLYKETPYLSDTDGKNTNNEESEEEGTSFQKLEFVDDEAMEAPDDYQSGDSMGEEEQKEIEENEVIDRGEYIGSEDSDEDGEEEDDEENDSFITSDSGESLLDYSDEADRIEDPTIKSGRSKGNRQILITSESESDEQSYAEKKAKKTKKIITSNKKKRILETSESENDEVSDSKSNQMNELINNDSNKTSKPLNFEVSRMIDDSSNEETTTNENSLKPPNKLDEAEKVTKDLIDKKIDAGYNDHSGDKRESNRHEFTRDDASELIEAEGREGDSDKSSSDKALSKLNESNIDGMNRRITSTTIDTSNEITKTNSRNEAGQTVLDSKDMEYEKPGEKYEFIVQQNKDESILDLNANENLKINLSNHSVDRQISVEYEKAPTKHKIRKSLSATGQSEIPVKLSEENNDTTNAANINGSQNESDLNLFMEKQKSGETNNEPKSKNEHPENENFEDEDIEIPETQEVPQVSENNHSNQTNSEESADEDSAEDTGYILSESKKPKVARLSVSFCQAKQKRCSIKGDKYVHHSSFSIGVGVIKKGNENEIDGSDSSEFEKESYKKRSNDGKNISESDTEQNAKPNDIQLNKDEEEELGKLASSDKPFTVLNRKRKSMAALEAHGGEVKNSKKRKRKSLQPISKEEFNPSQSLIDNIEDRKRELLTKMAASQTRLSKSFSGSIPEKSCAFTESSASDESSNEPKNKTDAYNSATPRQLIKGEKKDLGHIFDRCDEILEAANRAKLETKQNYKKSKIISPKFKKSSNHLDILENNGCLAEDVKHSKEKTTLALKQAFKASAKILMNEAYKNKKEKLQTNDAESTEKRLPMEVLESLSNTESSSEIKMSYKETRSEFVHRMNCATGEIVEEALSPPKKRTIFNKFELPTGTVLEEPVTPKKNTNNNGFRESPITPRTLGFKVRRILTAGQDKAPEIQNSYLRKRKQKIDDPQHVLPKPQWSQSGVFLEELLPSLNNKEKNKLRGASSMQTCGAGATTATQNALNFKNSTIFRKNIPRESAHEALKRKERQFARKQF
ncbi:PREDICTED: protein slender lobes [Rhagoletis zephyria]|uniref:protein slender lobes n=1 Tax=Rhagoletis zephyria TaxID=28612 RepID=UPI0008113AB3|nr:PREDICTED: protein slender lobes [Rhagoletis zephyria]